MFIINLIQQSSSSFQERKFAISLGLCMIHLMDHDVRKFFDGKSSTESQTNEKQIEFLATQKVF
jgi:hypothetical protein